MLTAYTVLKARDDPFNSLFEMRMDWERDVNSAYLQIFQFSI